jgi:hypothetical protein
MKRPWIRILLACAVLLGAIGPAFAGQADPAALPVDFLMKVDVVVVGADDYAKAAHIVDDICSFRLETTEPGANALRYDISLYRNGTLVRTYRDRPLPMTLKRNYRGMVDGDYAITFVAKDDVGRIGRGSATLRVRH